MMKNKNSDIGGDLASIVRAVVAAAAAAKTTISSTREDNQRPQGTEGVDAEAKLLGIGLLSEALDKYEQCTKTDNTSSPLSSASAAPGLDVAKCWLILQAKHGYLQALVDSIVATLSSVYVQVSNMEMN
ncbi:hypothetical protein H4219_000737 [Mycoemilia scoparia]|uniref:Uncharacterized protein n=1 Tax=Mycoemilia scoparia TaxID=417184 RepID=A0A9W8DWQ3_9FUNG|nr:hypothetical protein H4219_000737 [Mycoemilia scoparia]